MTQILWKPSDQLIASCAMTKFREAVNQSHKQNLKDSVALHQWSIDNVADFWDTLWDFLHIKGDKGATKLKNPTAMPGAQFFPEGKINYAENLLNHGRKDDETALHFWGEDKIKRQVTYKELSDQVSRLQQFFRDSGVQKGDRVAAFMPNIPETIIAMLGATSLGITWSSASPDFGVQGVLDRFGQIEPKILIAIDGYYYNSKWVDCLAKLKDIIPQIPSLEKVVLVSYDPQKQTPAIDKTIAWHDILKKYEPKAIEFNRVAFNHPLFIMFSSGTTGKPKCIVHGTGGPLLQLMKEHQLHCDVKHGDKVFYFTTCGWMMWQWQVTALASGATLCLYDGSPFAPDGNILWDYTDQTGVTLFGTGAKYIDMLHKQGFKPMETHKLNTMRTITSTGSVLVPESFDYVYQHIKKDVHLASISGGTDIVSCFVLGDPSKPVYRGEIQGPGIGLAMDIYRSDGTPAPIGEQGELVCLKPFPCMPISFWNDPDGKKYHKAYFERFPNIWYHGDYAEKTEHNEGYMILGRSDATLNPGGVRIGTAEIYNQVEKIPEVLESVAVAQKWDDDERVVLFVVMQKDKKLNDELAAKIKKQIREGASPRHMPAKIIQVADIPRTKSNKISEIAVRDTINGLQVANTEALANPQALEAYRDLPALREA